jgi:hypothetical protein
VAETGVQTLRPQGVPDKASLALQLFREPLKILPPLVASEKGDPGLQAV